jgi:transcriptional regulator with XRE-family HTH domain
MRHKRYLRCGAVAGRAAKSEEDRLRSLLRRVRTEAGLRQSDLAERMGRPQSFVSKYESGERELSFLEVRDVCRAAGLAFPEFVRRFERNS